MARTLTQNEFEHMLAELKKEAFDAWRHREVSRGKEGHFQSVVENLGDLAYEVDYQGIITYVNRSVENAVCKQRGELVGIPFVRLLRSESHLAALNTIKQTLEGKHTECELVLANGTVCHFKNNPLRDCRNNVIGVFSIARDITELKQSEKDLVQSFKELKDRLHELTAELLRASRKLQRGEAHSTLERWIEEGLCESSALPKEP